MDHRSLNPALDRTRFCPHCGAPEPSIEYPRSLHCQACDHRAFFNPSPVAGAIPRTPDGRIWLLRRGFHEGAGLWTFPGGFVDLGETVEEAARREAREEMCIDVELGRLVGVYSRPQERIVLVVYDAVPLGEPQTTPEATEVRAFAPAELPWDEMAFWSTAQALRDLLAVAA
jgi:ADP-ribose pyrophosphatase YjhB (NUDIX family)